MTRLNGEQPLVGIAMGSDSDLKIMQHVGLTLDGFDVPYEERVISAHRTPEKMMRYGHEAVERGLKVLVAGAGGSAHLPGMLASETRLPVLGVAIESSPDPTNAALGSMIRMPKGAPLATMGKNEAAASNAGLEAVRILALSDPELAEQYEEWMKKQAEEVEAKDISLRELGAKTYLLGEK
jgi:5-(carboxyamino)imidazole ribonucleotide mutase